MIRFDEIVAFAAARVNLPDAQKVVGLELPDLSAGNPVVSVRLVGIEPEGVGDGGQAGSDVGAGFYWKVSVALVCMATTQTNSANPYTVLKPLVDKAVDNLRRMRGDAPAGVFDIYLERLGEAEVGTPEQSLNALGIEAVVAFIVDDHPRFGDWGWNVANLDSVGAITAEVGLHSGTDQLTGSSPLGLRADFGLTSFRGALAQIDPDGVGGNNEETYSLIADTKGTRGVGRLVYLLAEMQQGGSVVRHGHGGIDPESTFTGWGGRNMPIPDEAWSDFIAADLNSLPDGQWRLLYAPAVRFWYGLPARSWFAKRTGNNVVCYAPDLYQDGSYLSPRLVKATVAIPQ